jgi:hypothetical protein
LVAHSSNQLCLFQGVIVLSFQKEGHHNGHAVLKKVTQNAKRPGILISIPKLHNHPDQNLELLLGENFLPHSAHFLFTS